MKKDIQTTSHKLKLRPYQEEAIETIEASIAFGSQNLVLKAETSFGKSITAAGICERFSDRHIVILVNIEPLIDQIAFFLDELNIDYSILKATRESEFDTHARVQLVMSQTYYARADKLNIKADIIIQDEVHKEYDTDRTKKILNDLEPEIRIGLSATPWNQAGYALQGTEIIETASCESLTKMGYLSKLNYYIPRWAEKIEYGSIQKSGSDYNLTSLDAVIASPKHLDKLVKAMDSRNAKNRKTLVFCSTIEQCDKIEHALVKAGYSAAAYHSKKSKKENERIMNSFKMNGAFVGTDKELESRNLFEDTEPIVPGSVIKCLISVSKLTTGFSVDDIDLGVIARPTKVKSLWHQMAGRMRRKADILDAWLDTLIEEEKLGQRVAMIASIYNEDAEIKRQLKEKRISYIDVFEYGTKRSSLDAYDVVIDNVRPNKIYGEVLDLGQCINNHGFPEEPYFPPVFTGFTLVDKKNMEDATSHLRMEHLKAIIDSDDPEQITRKQYEQKIEEIQSNEKKLTNLTIRQLSNKLEVSTSPTELIAITAVLFDKVHCDDNHYDNYGRPARGYTSNKGKDVVNFLNPNSISWIADNWIELLEKEDDYYRHKYIKSLRTRAKNLLKEKGSIWSLRFFIEWLIEEDRIEKEISEEGSSYENSNDDNSYEIVIDIDEDEVPF
jgi:superfamily II DNA or RNA helicase